MTYLLTEVADRERLANQARAISLGTWAASILLIGFALAPSIRNNPVAKAVLIFAGCGMTAVSRATAGNLALHDRVLQDFRDISDNQRQQLVYETLAPKQLMKSAAPETDALPEPAAALPVHNASREIASQLKSTVVLGAPRGGKGYAISRAVALLPSHVDLWLIDPKDDPNESHYWQRVPPTQHVRFDVTTLTPSEVNAKVSHLFSRYLEAASSAERPKLLIVDECAPGLAKGMTTKAYRGFMGRLSTICSVGPSKGKFVWIMAQASTVDDLAMSSGNKASFRLVAVGHAQQTEGSWYRSLKRSMGIETPAPELSGYIQMVDGQWGYAEPCELSQSIPSTHPPSPSRGPQLTTAQRELKAFLAANAEESYSLRELSGKGFAKRLNLRSVERLEAVATALVRIGAIAQDADGLYQIAA